MSSEERFEIFFKTHYASLCRGVHRLLQDESLAEDLVQEVFIKVWERKDKLTFNDEFIFYLKKSCYHAALGYLSDMRHKLNTHLSVTLTDAKAADTAILEMELENEVRNAISQLPEKTRLVFTLSRYEEMTYKQIAGQLKVSVKAVEKHMGIALKRLKQLLREHLVCLILLFF